MGLKISNYRIVSWVLVIIWMLVIFWFSSQSVGESSVLSEGISDSLLEVAELVVPKETINVDIFHNIVRNTGHFFLYLVLGILLMNALNINKNKGFTAIIIGTMIISLLYAVSDEIHQIYVPGRSWQVFDIIIDVLGAGAGILIYMLIIKYILRKKIIK